MSPRFAVVLDEEHIVTETKGSTLEDEPWFLLLLALCPGFRTLELSGHLQSVRDMPLLRFVLIFDNVRKISISDTPTPILQIEDVVLMDSGAMTDRITYVDVFPWLLLNKLRLLSTSAFWTPRRLHDHDF
jgi:hypothetical protein